MDLDCLYSDDFRERIFRKDDFENNQQLKQKCAKLPDRSANLTTLSPCASLD